MNEVKTDDVTRETIGERLMEAACEALPDNYTPTVYLGHHWGHREVHSDSEVV